MFGKIKELFETYSESSSIHPDPTLRSLNVNMGITNLTNSIIDILLALKYKTIRYNETFNEIYTKKDDFEVTIHFVGATIGSTTINVSVFSKIHRGKTRKALRFLLNKFKEEFSSYLAHE